MPLLARPADRTHSPHNSAAEGGRRPDQGDRTPVALPRQHQPHGVSRGSCFLPAPDSQPAPRLSAGRGALQRRSPRTSEPPAVLLPLPFSPQPRMVGRGSSRATTLNFSPQFGGRRPVEGGPPSTAAGSPSSPTTPRHPRHNSSAIKLATQRNAHLRQPLSGRTIAVPQGTSAADKADAFGTLSCLTERHSHCPPTPPSPGYLRHLTTCPQFSCVDQAEFRQCRRYLSTKCCNSG
jgi:hypothetical protein